MLASRFLTPRARGRPGAALDRLVRARLPVDAARLRARRSTGASRHRFVVLMVALATFVATVALFIAHPEGLLPEGGHRPDRGQRRGGRGHLVPGDGARCSSAWPRDPRRPGGRHACSSTRPTTTNNRAHVHQPEAARRAPADGAGAREPAPRACARCPGVNVYFSPIQNLRSAGALSKSRYQYMLQSVSGRELQRVGRAAAGAACAPTRCSAT